MHVVIADDDPVIRLLTSLAVERLGHRCSVAANGAEAWTLVDAGDVEALITDWEMPELDGTGLIARVRADFEKPYVYIVVLTGRADEESARMTMEAGADDFVVKPLDTADLERKLIAAERVTRMHRGMHLIARQDALTKIGNRLRLAEDLAVLCGRVERYGHRYSVVLLDIDHFKAYNDSEGHQGGDATLRAVAEVLLGQARSGDSLYRYGGEEFLMLLPEQTLEGAGIAAERLRVAVEAIGLPHPMGAVVTVSAGVASLGDSVRTPQEVFEIADQALYRAKAAGRNRVEFGFAPTPLA